MKIMVLPIVIISMLVVLGLGYGYSWTQSRQVSVNSSQNVSTTPPINASIQTSYCRPDSLQATLETEGAAGSTYGKLSIKNASQETCQIKGNEFIQATFVAKNISSQHQGQAGAEEVTLAPNQTVYSQVRFPNGAQCSHGTQQTTVELQYMISPTDFVVFKNQNSETKQPIITCTSGAEMTHIQVWSINTRPIS